MATDYGNIIERREVDEKVVEIELTNRKIILFRNREFSYFAMNECGVVFAN